jgi:Fic family protein
MADLEQKAKFIYNSNRLDGVHVPFERTLDIVQAPPDPLAESVEIEAMDGQKSHGRAVVLSHKEALDYVESNAKVARFTEQHLREIHRRLMDGVILSNGEYRECTLKYRALPPVPPDQIAARLARLLAIMNQGFDRAKDKAILAWQVHHEFIYVHPFIEGNGRTARLLLQMIRFRAGLDLEVVPFAEHERYMRSIVEYGRKLAAVKGA